MIWLATILFFLVLAAKVVHDVKLWREKEIKGTSTKTVNHGKGIAPVIGLLIPVGAVYFFELIMKPLPAVAVVFFMLFFTFWLLFDGFYNLGRGFHFFFTGSNDKDDAATDNLLQKMPVWLGALIKIGGAATLITIFITHLK